MPNTMTTPGVVRRGRWGRAMARLCGGALALNLVAVLGLVGLLAWNGLGSFWPGSLVLVEREEGPPLLGEVWGRERQGAEGEAPRPRLRLKVANREQGGEDFVWVDEAAIRSRSEPADAVLLERWEGGDFLGTMIELRRGGERIATDAQGVWDAFRSLHAQKLREREAVVAFERGEVREGARRLEQSLRSGDGPGAEAERLRERLDELQRELEDRRRELERETVVLRTADGQQVELAIGQVVRALRPNDLGLLGRLAVFCDRLGEFLFGEPRDDRGAGGIFPAICGTVLMVFLMTLAVLPLGVLAALYLHEYARDGLLLRLVRGAVNQLAAVPPIVFGVVALGFFVHGLGGAMDARFFPEQLPQASFGRGGILWASLTLALLTVPIVIVSTEEGLAAVPSAVREASQALGATRFETTFRVVLPAARSGVWTGVVLSIARAAGEVAPLLVLGLVQLDTVPLDARPPFLHLDQGFLHLGLQLFELGSDPSRAEAARPALHAMAFLLVSLVIALNLLAALLRGRLARRSAAL